MNKKIIIFFLITSALTLTAFFGLHRAGASRLILENGDLYSISETIGAQRYTNLGDIKFVFDQKYDKVLYGRGWEGAYEGAEVTGGTELWVRKLGSKQDQKMTDEKELVTYAFFDPQATKIYYTTENQDLFEINSDGSNKTKVMEKTLYPDLSRDGRYLVYQKLNADWQPPNYYDQALGLAVFDLETKEEKQVSNTWEDWGVIWAPKGNKIFFHSRSPEGLSSLFVMNSDGSDRKQLTNIGEKFVSDKTTPSPSEKPIWSNDGTHLVYESDRAIWHLTFNEAQNQVVKAEKIAYGIDPKWKVDGKSITVVTSPLGKEKSIQTIELK